MTTESYMSFLESKQRAAKPVGFDVRKLPSSLFPFQSAITKWSCRIGRAALFCDVGLGKTIMQLAWADAVQRKTKRPVLDSRPAYSRTADGAGSREVRHQECTHCRITRGRGQDWNLRRETTRSYIGSTRRRSMGLYFDESEYPEIVLRFDLLRR